MYYQECVLKQYRALREQGLNVDVISMEHVLDGYKILAVPMAYLFCDGYEEKLRDYVKQGGTLVEGVKNFVSLEVHASLDKSSICRNLLSVLGISCCRIFLLILV